LPNQIPAGGVRTPPRRLTCLEFVDRAFGVAVIDLSEMYAVFGVLEKFDGRG